MNLSCCSLCCPIDLFLFFIHLLSFCVHANLHAKPREHAQNTKAFELQNVVWRAIIAVFNNMRTLKFQPTVYVFRCRQSSKRTSQKTEVHFSRVKRSRLSVVIGGFRSILFVSVFQGSLALDIIVIHGSEKCNRSLGFEPKSSHVIENRNNIR